MFGAFFIEGGCYLFFIFEPLFLLLSGEIYKIDFVTNILINIHNVRHPSLCAGTQARKISMVENYTNCWPMILIPMKSTVTFNFLQELNLQRSLLDRMKALVVNCLCLGPSSKAGVTYILHVRQ